MRVLGIESSCDETAAAVVEDGTRLLATSLSSSAEIHRQYGGVVPEVAAREHTMAILPVVEETLKSGHLTLDAIDAVAVTEGPGLLGALLIGVTFAKALADALAIPVIGVHHLEAHLYANAMEEPIRFPALALLVSGGHTSLVYWTDHGQITVLGETRDDAAGEAFDKGARILGLPYPGGPHVERLAREANGTDLRLPVANLGKNSLDFSFSGVKTATQELFRDQPERIPEIAWALQHAVVSALVKTVDRAASDHPAAHVYLAGGVTANGYLREQFFNWGRKKGVTVHIPRAEYCTDNAAMVAALGYHRYLAGHIMPTNGSPKPSYPLEGLGLFRA